MALVKKTASTKVPPQEDSGHISAQAQRDAEIQRRKARTLAKQQQASERISAASNQLASGIRQGAAAAEELKRAVDQIATGAEEASSASQESLKANTLVASNIKKQSEMMEAAKQKAENLQILVGQISNIIVSTVSNVGMAAKRQSESVKMVEELERQAAKIGDIVKAVARIADQTNLLALNAAIEAARAGKHGKGFAVVADEVRTLAETSEKSARDIQDLVGQIQKEVKVISEGIKDSAQSIEKEVERGNTIITQLDKVRGDMSDIVEGTQVISASADESNRAAQEAIKGAEAIAAAAEEQSAACEEAAKTVDQQSQALTQSETAINSLADLAEDLKNSTDIAKSAEEVASAAEELSSALQEINRASSQIMTALEQIRKGAQVQAGATTESSSAINQIEKGSELSEARTKSALERTQFIRQLMGENKNAIDILIKAIGDGVATTRKSFDQVKELAVIARRIDKIVDAITTVSIQTNMLAVNGAIEAARAGEFGKGFVVVSTDIRNLAHDSSENADNIKDLVKDVQDQISVVQRDLEEIMNSSINEVEKTRSINSSLATIEKDVVEIERGNRTALETIQQIVTAIGQAKVGVDQISSAAQEAEKAAAEAASAARQQSQSAEELAAAIEEIASLADELQSN